MLVILPAPRLQSFLWWLCRVRWNSGVEQYTEIVLRVKEMQESLQRNRQIQSWAEPMGINELPSEVRESSWNCQIFLKHLEYPFTDASAVTAGLEYRCTSASAVAVETVGSGCLLAVLLQSKNCLRRAWLGLGLGGTFIVFLHAAICNLYFNLNPLANFFSFAFKCLICMWYLQWGSSLGAEQRLAFCLHWPWLICSSRLVLLPVLAGAPCLNEFSFPSHSTVANLMYST